MIVLNSFSFKTLLASALCALAFSQPVAAAEISGVKLEETVKVAGKDLKLSGYGMRKKFVIKVYAVGLYLQEKAKTVDEMMKMDGPRRTTIVMMREVSSEDFGKAFMAGLNDNSDTAEKTKLTSQIFKFGEMFGAFPGLKKGDVLHLDFTPGVGTQVELNGKKVGEPVPDLAFYNAIVRIWVGPNPVDSSLKADLLK